MVMMMHSLRVRVGAAAVLALVGAAAWAADRPGGLDPAAIGHHLQGSLPRFGRPEIVEMFAAIASGSHMGPGEGWFHAGQSRYGWQWLAARHGIAPDGSIARKDFRGPTALFDRLDRNRDGVLNAGDFDWSDRSAFLGEQQKSANLFRLFDADSNGQISREEWDALFMRAARGKDYLSQDDLREALFPPPPPRMPRQANDGPTPVVLFLGLLEGELGSMWEGPKVGQRAPDFTRPTHDGKRRVRLSEFRGHKPVVLVFGSFT
jgi:hypothetical protein